LAGRRDEATQANQFTFDWSVAVLPNAEQSQFARERATTPEPVPQSTPEPEPRTDPMEFRHPDLVQVLPWDFRTSFPEPLEEAILNGKLQPEDGTPENLKALNDEHARHALALLSDLDAIATLGARASIPTPARHREPRSSDTRWKSSLRMNPAGSNTLSIR
jgi:hypothetical protein